MTVSALRYDTSSNALLEMPSSDIELLAQYILYQLAQTTEFDITSTSGSGSALIGNLVNFYSYPIGTSIVPGDLLVANNYLYQTQTSSGGGQPSNPQDYVGCSVSGSSVVLQEAVTTLNDLADEIITRLVGPTYGGPGSWYIGAAAPVDNGQWVTSTSIVDAVDSSTNATTYYIWKKTSSNAYGAVSINSVNRPLKIVNNELVEFSDTDINYLIKTVADRIASRGVNFYQISPTVPTTGTWVVASEAIQDLVRTENETVFASSFQSSSAVTSFYIGGYQGVADIVGYASNTYTGQPQYTLDTTAVFLGSYTGILEQNFINFIPFVGGATYSGPGAAHYTYFIPEFISGEYLGAGTGYYVGQANYGGPPTSPITPDMGPGGSYPFGTYFAGYMGATPYTGGSTTVFSGTSTPYIGLSITYTGPGPAYFENTDGASYTASATFYLGPPLPYVSVASFTGPVFSSFYTGSVVAPSTYVYNTNYMWRRIA